MEIEAYDFFGKTLVLGDKVVFVQLGYRNFLVGEVVKLTKKTAIIKHKNPYDNKYCSETKQFHNQLIRI